MPALLPSLRTSAVIALLSCAARAGAQEAPSLGPGPTLHKSNATSIQEPAPPPFLPQPPSQPSAAYDPALFQKPIPAAQLTFLTQYDGAPTSDLYRDKQFRKLVHSALPGCTFHYGIDVGLSDALDAALESSRTPVQLREGRYLLLAGRTPVYPGLQGHALVWIDLHEGIVLGGFYFRPTNGEPTPALNLFSRQIKEDALALSELPPAFAPDLAQWSYNSGVPPITYRYFITGANKKILLEHDENFCVGPDGSLAAPDSGCEQMAADAADLDMDAAYYLDQTHHATNATAYMLRGDDQIAFIDLRTRSCRIGPDPLGCRIHLTREHIHGITVAVALDLSTCNVRQYENHFPTPTPLC